MDNINGESFKGGAFPVGRNDVERVLGQQDRLRRLLWVVGALRPLADDALDLLCLLRDYFAGRYPDVPRGTVATVAFALLYVLNPLDLIPDVIAILGWGDDAAVLTACLGLVRGDLEAWRNWRLRSCGPRESVA